MRVQPQHPNFAAKRKYTVFCFVGNQNTKKKDFVIFSQHQTSYSDLPLLIKSDFNVIPLTDLSTQFKDTLYSSIEWSTVDAF